MNKFIVITTVNPKSEAVEKYQKMNDWRIIVVGDRKSELIESKDNLEFLGIDKQLDLGFRYARECPYDHYSRKNIGYLYAIKCGANVIYDTDDDNIPYCYKEIPDFSHNIKIASSSRFINIYKYFTDTKIWPRGFPLDEIKAMDSIPIPCDSAPVKIGIWQELCDADPDVDAIYRLINDEVLYFHRKGSVYLEKSRYCPINSQSTLWSRAAFQFLYLPGTVEFRFSDILRGYIAQRLLWECDMYAGFAGPTVYQKRNPHDLMRDFSEELNMYLNTKSIVELLEMMSFGKDGFGNLKRAYKALCDNQIVPAAELELLELWNQDMKEVY